MKTASAHPIGPAAALSAELRFLLARRWIPIALLTLAAFAVNWLVNARGFLFQLMPFGWRDIMALVWAGVVWAGERPAEREYFLGAPLGAACHELTRVIAGGVYLALPIASMLGGEALVATPFRPATLGVGYVVGSFTGPATIYLLVSSVALASAWPAAWFLGIVLALNFASLGPPLAHIVRPFFSETGWGFGAAVSPIVPILQANGRLVTDRVPWAGVHLDEWGPVAAGWLLGSALVLLVVTHRRLLARMPRAIARHEDGKSSVLVGHLV